MTTKTRLDDLTTRVQRLERKNEQLEVALNTSLKSLATWITGMNDIMATVNERSKTQVADMAELLQHIRGKMEL